MNILVVGMGSAGMRFVRILKKLNQNVLVYEHRPAITKPLCTKGVADLAQLDHIDGAVITSPTYTHYYYAQKLIAMRIPLLVEKPLSESLDSARTILREAKRNNVFIMVGFNLRFLPIIETIDAALREKIGTVYYARIEAGFYLPLWKQHKSYSKTYRAHYSQGGGVALDLIHEIDLAYRWFKLGKTSKVRGEKLSILDIDCEDFVQITADKPFPIQIILDYLSHIPTRIYHIAGSEGTIYCDIYNHTYTFTSKDGTSERTSDPSLFDIQKTYTPELAYFLDHLHASNPEINERTLGIDALRIAVGGRKHVPR